jgi:hypothetical protein
VGWLKRYRHVQLLVALSLLVFVNPFLVNTIGDFFLEVFLSLTFVAAVIACSTHRWHLVVGLVLTALMSGGGFYRDYVGTEALNVSYCIVVLMFLVFITYLVLRDVLAGGDVDPDKICGALSAYLFMGLTWAFAYALLEAYAPGSLTGLDVDSGGFTPYNRFVGYSFVTITTLGYGNVVPATAQADALSVAEAIVGQVYLTVLVARLVGLSLRPHNDGNREETS